MEPVLTGTKGWFLRGELAVNGLGDKFLAGAALALDQHGGAAGSDLADQVKDLQHGVALADDMLKVVTLFEGALELFVFLFHRRRATAARTSASSFSLSQGFWMKLVAPRCMARTALSTRAIGGNHDDGELGITRADIAQDFQPVAVRQGKIKQHQIEGPLIQAGQSIFAGFGRFHAVTFQFEQRLQRLTNRRLHRQ